MATTSSLSHRQIDILLVEDDEADVLLTKRELDRKQIYNSLTVAGNGWEALGMLRGENGFERIIQPDLILLDLNMPRLNGRETLEHLKKDENLRHIPVVILTTSDSDEDIRACYERQCSCFITKPADLGSFQEFIGSIRDFWLTSVQYQHKPHC